MTDNDNTDPETTGPVEELPAIDEADESHEDAADLEPTEEEAEEGNRQGKEIDPDDDESGSQQ